MRRTIAVTAFFCLILTLSGKPAATQEPKVDKGKQNQATKEVTIVSPKDGDKVDKLESLDGKLSVQDGWPVVLVQPQAGGQPWWVQSTVDQVDKGKFSASVQFGEDDTPAGTKFKICVVLAPSKQAADKYKTGDRLASPPAGLPRSEIVSVTRK
jgi:hypothetical protein